MARTRTNDYSQPTEVTDVMLAFPAQLGALLPPMSAIPDDYPDRSEWDELVEKWFFGRLPDDCEMHPAEGIDAQTAGRHLGAILRSYEPKHEHKMAGAAWLASLWFAEVTTPDGSYKCPGPRAQNRGAE